MNSKIKNMTKSSVPLKWEGEFDGSIMKESVTYQNGAVVEMQLSLSQVNDNDVMKMLDNEIEIEFLNEDDEDQEDGIDEMYVMVEENGKKFPIHKDILPDYMEMISMDLKIGM
tara:strand:+ start:1226 stop:1564 length:339 start_codon:yes stop_codon:yes gene_type:complete